jgi:hypothetical protein
MKFLNINATINVKPQFDGEVLKAGTPLDISGAIANSDAAVGLVANDTAKGAESIAIVTEGTIDLTEVAASYGEALSDDCIAALKGITFLYGGKAIVPSGGGLPDYSEASDGDVLGIENGAPAWITPSGGGGGYLLLTVGALGAVSGATPDEVRAAATEGKPIFIQWGSAVRPAAVEGLSGKSGYVRMWGVTVNSDPMTGDAPLVFKWEISFNSSSFGNCTNTTYPIGN